MQVASIIMAAGRGSRMQGYAGNKTLLPLKPGESAYQGEHPILLNLFDNLPAGPKALIVNHCRQDVQAATGALDIAYHEQPVLNGTGGAILAAQPFIASQAFDRCIITMGDVPFVTRDTYRKLVAALDSHDLVVLGFEPEDKKQYGVLEIEAGQVKKITEWKFWRDYPEDRRAALTVCNSGIYAVTKTALQQYLPIMASNPQIVEKEVDGKMTAIEEFFFTDLIEHMVNDQRPVGYAVAENEIETMGIDDLDALQKAQTYYKAITQTS